MSASAAAGGAAASVSAPASAAAAAIIAAAAFAVVDVGAAVANCCYRPLPVADKQYWPGRYRRGFIMYYYDAIYIPCGMWCDTYVVGLQSQTARSTAYTH